MEWRDLSTLPINQKHHQQYNWSEYAVHQSRIYYEKHMTINLVVKHLQLAHNWFLPLEKWLFM